MDVKTFYGKKQPVHVLIPDVDSADDFSSDDSIEDRTYKPNFLAGMQKILSIN